MGFKSRARLRAKENSVELPQDIPNLTKAAQRRYSASPNKGIIRRIIEYFRFRVIGIRLPWGGEIMRAKCAPEVFETGRGSMKITSKGFLFHCEMENWEANGYGVMEVDGNRYEGQFRHDLPHGKGKEVDADGLVTEGNWENGKPSGFVSMETDLGIYKGIAKGWLPHGKGKYRLNDEFGSIVEGNFKDGQLSGPGVIRNPLGFSSEGSFIDGFPNPHVDHKITWPGGDYFIGKVNRYGEIENGSFYHEGKEKPSYVGEFNNEIPNGRGLLVIDDNLSYNGNLKDGVPHGAGFYIQHLIMGDYEAVTKVTGNFVEGKPEGKIRMEIQDMDVPYIVEGEINQDDRRFSILSDDGGDILVGEEKMATVLDLHQEMSDEEGKLTPAQITLFEQIIENMIDFSKFEDSPDSSVKTLPGGREPLERLLQSNEGLELEFKASIWIGYDWSSGEFASKQQKKDDRLQDSVIKTIAGFLNSQGGTLLIGVADKIVGSDSKTATILGIESDFRWFKRGLESYDHALREAIRDAMSDKTVELHSSNIIDISYPEFDGKQICRVDVKGIHPEHDDHIWTKTKTLGEDLFFVRTADSTMKLSPQDANRYIARRSTPRYGK